MADFYALNVETGTREPNPKWDHIGETNEVWAVTVPATIAAADIIHGPIIPAGTYLTGLTVDTAGLDSGGTTTCEVGYATALAAFVATGNTTVRAGGIIHNNVAGSTGFTAATNTEVLMTMVAAVGTGVSGRVAFRVRYTSNP